MPIDDWTRVSAGTWRNFHLAWITKLRSSLNNGGLPTDYYALAEQFVGPHGPDALTLQETQQEDWTSSIDDGSIAVKTSPPQTRLVVETDHEDYVPKRSTISIRHFSDDRTVALIELVSPDNKASQQSVQTFVEKAIETLCRAKVAYLEPTAVAKPLIDMQLFLTAKRDVLVPLQSTYDRAYQGLPNRWQRVLVGRQL